MLQKRRPTELKMKFFYLSFSILSLAFIWMLLCVNLFTENLGVESAPERRREKPRNYGKYSPFSSTAARRYGYGKPNQNPEMPLVRLAESLF